VFWRWEKGISPGGDDLGKKPKEPQERGPQGEDTG
jgi:hypothetical protein